MTKIDQTTVKKYAKVAYRRFDMCVSTMFSPFAGVLYTVSELEKSPDRSPSRLSSVPSSRSSSRASHLSGSDTNSDRNVQIY